MNKKLWIIPLLLSLIACLSFSQTAYGETGEKKITTVNFEDMLISGQTKKSSSLYLFERRHGDLNSLIKIKSDYRKEIAESVDQ